MDGGDTGVKDVGEGTFIRSSERRKEDSDTSSSGDCVLVMQLIMMEHIGHGRFCWGVIISVWDILSLWAHTQRWPICCGV